jgi:hypothetical protein
LDPGTADQRHGINHMARQVTAQTSVKILVE